MMEHPQMPLIMQDDNTISRAEHNFTPDIINTNKLKEYIKLILLILNH